MDRRPPFVPIVLPPDAPALRTERLRLRPPTPADAPAVQQLAGDALIASTTANIPHPYEDGLAEAWIASCAESYARTEAVTLAIFLAGEERLVGAMGLHISPEHARAELGYWIGVPYWNRGYASEAGMCVLHYGFETLGLERIHAMHFARNPASGRVMQKIGMQHEGTLRRHILKDGCFEDAVVYGALREAWLPRAGLPEGR